VWGPKGSGKSALVATLFGELNRLNRHSRSGIHTTTRIADSTTTEFAYVDARDVHSEFALCRAILSAIVEESVPNQGVGIDHLRSLLDENFASPTRRGVVAIDHVGEAGTYPLSTVDEFLGGVSASVARMGIGRLPPKKLVAEPGATVEFEPYDPHLMIDIVSSRASVGLARNALDHGELRRIAEWADGDAHDALAAVFGAAVVASDVGDEHIDSAAITTGIEAVPRPCAATGSVLSLPTNRQRVLRRLIELDSDEYGSVQSVATAVADSIALSATTVERFLYELADSGVVRRASGEPTNGPGRPPSRLEPRFPTLVFRRLFDLRAGHGSNRQ